MGLIEKLPQILAESRAEYEAAQKVPSCFCVDSEFGRNGYAAIEDKENSAVFGANLLAVGNNAAFMNYLAEERKLKGKVQLIYIDPPFFSKANYGTEIRLSSEKLGTMPKIRQFAYHDLWQEGMEEYLKMLCIRFYQMKDLLSEEGCLWVHLDWHIVHYVKILLDEIFGEKNFINEIIWHYKSGGSSKRHYARKHDTLLFYAKSKNYYFCPQKEKSYNRDFKPYRFKGVREYRDETGWYTMVNMKDVWQLDMVGRTSAERTGYVTQKPEALIARILESCTRKGDLVADFFGGSGTLAAAAEKMGRNWIYCDLGMLAAVSAKKRLAKIGSRFDVLVQKGSEAEKNTCRIEVLESIEHAGATDSSILRLELTGYRPDENSQLPVDVKSSFVLCEAMNKDPLRFIEFWSVDYFYDGSVHRACDVFYRNGTDLVLTAEKIGKRFSKISIRAHDIFGNTAEKLISL